MNPMNNTKRQRRKKEWLLLECKSAAANEDNTSTTTTTITSSLQQSTKSSPFAVFPSEIISNILSFLLFRLNRYISRIFSKSHYNNNNNNNINGRHSYISDHDGLRHIESQLYKLLFGSVQSQKSTPTLLIAPPTLSTTTTTTNNNKSTSNCRDYFSLWSHIDLSIKSCYQLDQQEDLSVEQLLVLSSCLRNQSSINLRGHIHFNDYCVTVLMKNNPQLQFLDLQSTQVDYEGIKSILLTKAHSPIADSSSSSVEDATMSKSNSIVPLKRAMFQHTHILKTLKLSRLSRAPLTEANVTIFKYCRSLVHLELSNNGLHLNEVKKLICYPNVGTEETHDKSIVMEPLPAIISPSLGSSSESISYKQFTKLNLSCNTITDEGAKVLSMCSSLKVLILEDCGLGNDGMKHLLEIDPESSASPYHRLTNLTKLNVSHNRPATGVMSDEGLAPIVDHKTLKHLILSDNNFGDAVANYLSANSVLEYINLDHTKLTYVGVGRILMGDDPPPIKPAEAAEANKKELVFKSNVMNTLKKLNIRFIQATREEVVKLHSALRQHQQKEETAGKTCYPQFKILAYT